MTVGLDNARLDVLVHEVRSPVAALSAVAETAGESELDESVHKQLVRLAIAACRAIERIILDLAVASVRIEPLDAVTLARDAAASFAMRGADVAAEVHAAPIIVDGDPVRLRQVLDNLIENALRHGASSRAVVVRVTCSGAVVTIAVRDAGRGIPADELARIFDPGVRLDETALGSGLGPRVVPRDPGCSRRGARGRLRARPGLDVHDRSA